MTANQSRLLSFIRGYVAKHGHMPKQTTMGEEMGCHFTAASVTLKRLARDGHLIRTGHGKYALPPPKCCPNCGHEIEAA